MVQDALRRHRGKITSNALELGISRPTLYELMEKLGITEWRAWRPDRRIFLHSRLVEIAACKSKVQNGLPRKVPRTRKWGPSESFTNTMDVFCAPGFGTGDGNLGARRKWLERFDLTECVQTAILFLSAPRLVARQLLLATATSTPAAGKRAEMKVPIIAIGCALTISLGKELKGVL